MCTALDNGQACEISARLLAVVTHTYGVMFWSAYTARGVMLCRALFFCEQLHNHATAVEAWQTNQYAEWAAPEV